VKCWRIEIMEKEYEDPLDMEIKKFDDGNINYR
jgi:hypothetical protein